jgi:hypothetical protein
LARGLRAPPDVGELGALPDRPLIEPQGLQDLRTSRVEALLD